MAGSSAAGTERGAWCVSWRLAVAGVHEVLCMEPVRSSVVTWSANSRSTTTAYTRPQQHDDDAATVARLHHAARERSRARLTATPAAATRLGADGSCKLTAREAQNQVPTL